MLSSIVSSACQPAGLGRIAAAAFLVGALIVPLEATGGNPGTDVLKQVIDSSAFLRVERTYSGHGFSTSGTGFLIHRDGWILTNEHVIGDSILVSVGGRLTRTNARVTGVVAVFDSGNPNQVELDAKIVARDADADLALLKVAGPQDQFIELWNDSVPSVTDEVWVVGFPFGELLEMERWKDSVVENPVVSVNQGRVSALRRNQLGELAFIQTDAAVNPGNSGGPMVDRKGAFLGVVSIKVGTDGIGFAIASEQVRRFVMGKGYSVEFQPTVITDSTRRVAVRLESQLIDLQGMTGKLTISGENIPDGTAPLQWDGHGLRAGVDLVENAAYEAAEGLLTARIELRQPEQRPAVRLFRLNGQSSTQRMRNQDPFTAREASANSSAAAPKPPQSSPVILGGGKFDAARSKTQVGKPAVVISDELMAKIQEYKFSEERYADLPYVSWRDLAEEYDRTFYDLYRAVVRFYQRDRSNRDVTRSLRNQINSFIDKLRTMQPHLEKNDMCRCGSKWRSCSDEACNDPEKPWVDDDLSEIRSAVREGW